VFREAALGLARGTRLGGGELAFALVSGAGLFYQQPGSSLRYVRGAREPAEEFMPQRRYRAAGGVVLDRRDRVLLLERDVVRGQRSLHEVRLPKGHIEAGEADTEAAIREVREESGYQELAVLADLGLGEITFKSRGQQVTRSEHYFLMRLLADERGTPTAQGEEALFVPLWASDFESAERSLTYEGERAFVRRARDAYRVLRANAGSEPG
jgi:ADP-ribose pyrophosphatase YjhB (NUDIX family)